MGYWLALVQNLSSTDQNLVKEWSADQKKRPEVYTALKTMVEDWKSRDAQKRDQSKKKVSEVLKDIKSKYQAFDLDKRSFAEVNESMTDEKKIKRAKMGHYYQG